MTHVSPRRTYYLVFLALMVLTAVTTGVAYLDLGPFNTVVALAIAFLKAGLVVAFFMHVMHLTNLSKLFAVGALVWMVILIALTVSDYWTRQWGVPAQGW
ncbi:MAG: cytochrome C oxidase subunit IV family protein [Bryobacteraceae bacterium]|nr:cytochrome C oxidase subunit IV family protein [Bryobacteraceae bacterium]